MVTLKNLTAYTPVVNPYATAGFNVLFYKDSEGRDWYESQALFAADTLKVCYGDNGVIIQCAYDASMLTPQGLSVSDVKGLSSEVVVSITDGTWVFDGEKVVKRTYTAEEIQLRAESQRQSKLATANTTIADWRTDLQLGVITDEDKASLIKWMSYVRALKALDFTNIIDEIGYNAIEWPNVPNITSL